MLDPFQQIEEFSRKFARNKRPIAAVVRPDVYELLKTSGEFHFKDALFGFPSLPVVPDPAADSVAMAEIEQCKFFYDQESLNLYLAQRRMA